MDAGEKYVEYWCIPDTISGSGKLGVTCVGEIMSGMSIEQAKHMRLRPDEELVLQRDGIHKKRVIEIEKVM